MSIKELNPQNVELIIKRQKKFFNKQITLDINFRIHQLKKLKSGIKKYEEQIIKALYKDLGKHKNESYMTEIGFVYHSISLALKNLKKWTSTEKRSTPIFLMPAKSYIVHEPYGCVLIIGPYNYPFQLLIEPLVGAIAAGNTAVLKTSELAPNVSRVVKEMIEDTFPKQYIRCVEGAVETNQSLIHARFDYIFFTGSVGVGKIVMKAAADNLVPVTLELGGKSPVIVDESADMKEAARRIIWGKTINAGQTCVAPDYVLVQESVKNQLVKEMKIALQQFFGEDIEKSDSFGRIINARHFNRIKAMIEKDQENIVFGGNYNENDRYIEPTLIEISSWNAATMQEEIFGPVLPIMTYHSLDKTIAILKELPKPLALYLFTRNKRNERKVLSEISCGNLCINDTISHVANPYLPFGGVGNSGIGAYHGRDSFLTFSHRKGVLKKPARLNNSLSYPSFHEKQLKLVKIFFR
ncbi:aldehyde dehydrogenase [Anaeromicropila herbilytica]|uniref:Aldehyde dehydrogenase n=1 Tax=Anaeromicropila herbilytica TaxID=2785025 RepID=A0A7R7IF58_9FIRM|nr:aldehyde dehydrogenase [Anaeromicropila herbilytica]BCN31808.1 aldehyde dehydrogenase [Anaeromicropila herbilytica]